MEPNNRAHSAIDNLIRQTETPTISKLLFEYMSIPGAYQKTYVPGEAELAARVFGVEDLVNPLTYERTTSIAPAIPFVDQDLLRYDIKEMDEEASYLPEQSPLTEIMNNIFEVNPNTEFGQNLQDRINVAYSLAKEYGQNPDTGEMMLKGKEPLLGDVYFDKSGNFEDVWDVGIGEFESIHPKGTNPLEALINLFRMMGQDKYQMNRPVVRGRAERLR